MPPRTKFLDARYTAGIQGSFQIRRWKQAPTPTLLLHFVQDEIDSKVGVGASNLAFRL